MPPSYRSSGLSFPLRELFPLGVSFGRKAEMPSSKMTRKKVRAASGISRACAIECFGFVKNPKKSCSAPKIIVSAAFDFIQCCGEPAI